MTRKFGRVGDDRMVADKTVMGDMHVVHQQHLVADAREHPAALGAAMDGGEFTDAVVVANLEPRRLAMILEILRSCADRSELKDAIAGADRRLALDYRVRADDGAGTDADLGGNYCTRADFNRRVEFGPSIDDRSGMNPAGYGSCSSTSIADSSASAASSPSTRASPCIFQSG
jgi:hypothetical protein